MVRLQWPLVIAERITSDGAQRAQEDQNGHRLSAWQQYACRKFGNDCRVALAIQRAENPQGKCEVYHYNSDGTLDWGYFQINTVHLKRPGLKSTVRPISISLINFTASAAASRRGAPTTTVCTGGSSDGSKGP